MRNFTHLVIVLLIAFSSASCEKVVNKVIFDKIDREAVVLRHSPSLNKFDPTSPFTLGNGDFAFTADVTGLQSYGDVYYERGIPLETKARWAWHTRSNPENHTLDNTNESYTAYGREVDFPTNLNSDAAQWLRQNPHDLPLARIGFSYKGENLREEPENIQQTLNLFDGELLSEFSLDKQIVKVKTLVDNLSDTVAVSIHSELLNSQNLAVDIRLPRGYKLDKKNTPDLDFGHPKEHRSKIFHRPEGAMILQHNIDDGQHLVFVQWQTDAEFIKIDEHHYRLVSRSPNGELVFCVKFLQDLPKSGDFAFSETETRVAASWRNFWSRNAFVDFSGSTHPMAVELERRIILSRYLMATQERASIPAQESGLTHSSWYGKHHTEMAWWHSAHWSYWGQPVETEKALHWFKSQLPAAEKLASQRGLEGARWAKMVGPDNRESPGGNPLIIWNQPQIILLAELVYQSKQRPAVLREYSDLVDETAQAMSSMLVFEKEKNTYNLDPPIWIAQEIYDPRSSRNPTFELAYWRKGLEIAQAWRERQGKQKSKKWQSQISNLAPLPTKDNKYVALESIPDTFDNIASRQDHPSMLAAYGLLNDSTVNKQTMLNTLHAVLDTWDWDNKIWGWDYPLVAMTAMRLGETELAMEILLADKTHNRYLNNGHVPQEGADLRVYLPANGALLAAIGMMIAGWEGAPAREFPGFSSDGSWSIKAEGFNKFQ